MNIPKIRNAACVLGAALVSYALLMHNARAATAPHAAMIGWLYGCRFIYDPAVGYLSREAGIAITPGCMGATLFVALFLIRAFGGPPTARRWLRLIADGALSLTGAFGVSIVRIALSLPFAFHPKAQLIHNLLSLALYFGAALALTLSLQRRRHCE